MYGTNGPVGAATVVDTEVVVSPEVVVGAGAVVVVPDDVVGAVVVVAPELVEAVVVVAPEVESVELVLDGEVGVVSEKVLPIVIGDTSPNAPETSRPSANTAASATVVLIWRLRPPRFMRPPSSDACEPGPQPDSPGLATPLLAPQLPQSHLRPRAAWSCRIEVPSPPKGLF
jgi:hypothetical protein